MLVLWCAITSAWSADTARSLALVLRIAVILAAGLVLFPIAEDGPLRHPFQISGNVSSVDLITFEACVRRVVSGKVCNTTVLKQDKRGVDIFVIGDCTSHDAMHLLDLCPRHGANNV